jgi:hypothetical protein
VVQKHRLRALTLAAAALAVAVAAPTAHAAYTGSIDAGAHTVTLKGSDDVLLFSQSGLVRHNNLGPAFADDTDFDTTAGGVQTVPDTGGWTFNVTGGGKEELRIEEREPTSPTSFAFGHTFFPGGVPCVVRDPNNRHGAISFSQHPAEETRFCYPGGFDEVSVHATDRSADFGVLDTEPGVTLRLHGSTADDTMTEVANVPSSVQGEFHNPESPVYFYGSLGNDMATFDDGPADEPATYRIENGAIHKSGLPPLHFDKDTEFLSLYPEHGPSTIVQGATGGAPLQIFGGFFGQEGPDKIDARAADAPLLATGTTGDDTIFGSVFPDYIDGGGGNDRIDSRDSSFDQVLCEGGTGAVTTDRLDRLTDCPTAKTSPPLVALRGAKLSPGSVKRGKKVTFSAVSTVSGKVTLKFKRGVSRKVAVQLGLNAVRFKLPGKLRKGRYNVSATLRGAKPVKLSLTVR